MPESGLTAVMNRRDTPAHRLRNLGIPLGDYISPSQAKRFFDHLLDVLAVPQILDGLLLQLCFDRLQLLSKLAEQHGTHDIPLEGERSRSQCPQVLLDVTHPLAPVVAVLEVEFIEPTVDDVAHTAGYQDTPFLHLSTLLRGVLGDGRE